MDFTTQNKADAFDTLFTTNHIRMLKAILPYMDNQMQKNMAVYIKFMELRYTLQFLTVHPYPLCGCMPHKPEHDFSKIFTDILPFCNENEKKQMEQFREIFRSMEMYREISKTMEMMKEFMLEGENNNLFGDFSSFTHAPEGESSSQNFDMMNILMNLLTDEQKEMFQMLNI